MGKSLKRSTTYRLTDEARALQATLAAKLGLTLSATLELSIRRLAEAEGVSTKPGKQLMSEHDKAQLAAAHKRDLAEVAAVRKRDQAEVVAARKMDQAEIAAARKAEEVGTKAGARTRAFPVKPKAK